MASSKMKGLKGLTFGDDIGGHVPKLQNIEVELDILNTC